MAKEHRQAAGQPPKVGAGARLSRASTRGRGSARAHGATAMLKRGSSQHQRRGLAAVVGVSVCVVHLMKSRAKRLKEVSHTVALLVALWQG